MRSIYTLYSIEISNQFLKSRENKNMNQRKHFYSINEGIILYNSKTLKCIGKLVQGNQKSGLFFNTLRWTQIKMRTKLLDENWTKFLGTVPF